MSRIELRRVRSGDAADLIAANQANQHYHRPWVASLTDQAGFDAWFARTLTGPNVGLLARERVGPPGWRGQHQRDRRRRFLSAYLGYYGMSEFRGSGMMGEALRATVELAFGELGLHRLEANVQPANTASLALLRRAGFRKEGFSPRYLRIDGQWRDHERWALLADDAAPAGAEGLAGGDGQA